MGSGSTQTFVVFNGSFCGSVEASFDVVTGDSWLSVDPATAIIPAGGQVSAKLTADRSQLPPGQSFAAIIVSVPGTSVSLQISVQIDGPDPTPAPTPTPSDTTPPFVSGATATCVRGSIAVSATVSDASGVTAVVLDNGIVQQPLTRTSGTAQSGEWTGTFIYNTSATYWQLIAYDTAANPAYATLRPSGCQ
jgi:hypothetical protein